MRALASAVVALVVVLTASAAAPRIDFAATAFTILPPGQNGSVAFDRNTNDQAKLYDALTPLRDRVTARDLGRYFKPGWFGARRAGPVRAEATPRRGLTITRDRFGVAHVVGKTRADVWWGAGWVAAADRGLLMDLLRGAGRLSALDAPGYNAFDVALTGRKFEPSVQTERFIGSQFALLRAAGRAGREALADVDAFVAGLNGYYRAKNLPVAPWTRNDVVAVATVIASRFGAGGGDEARRSMFLSALRARLGNDAGLRVWEDLRELDDPEAPATAPQRFAGPVHRAPGEVGTVVLDDAAQPPAPARREPMSNALLVGRQRSATGHPLLVAGPQLGYFFPEVVLEYDLHGGGVDVRGVAVPGVPWVVIGRGKDFAWSATSSSSDIVDTFVETLCGGDDFHYVFQGQCREITTFDAGVLKGSPGKPDTRVTFRETVHGPVIGYASVGGRRVALARKRSTRGRELLSALAFKALNENVPTTPASFVRVMNGIEFSFNWFYADDRHIAFFSSGRIPLRAPGTDGGLPTDGRGGYEWRGFLSPDAHPQAVDPPSALILNWNNIPARGFRAADDNWSYGSVHRVELLSRALAGKVKVTASGLVGAMNLAATQDLRAVRVWPVVRDVLRTGPPASALAEAAAALVDTWRAAGASRLDRDLDGKIDDPGAAVLDAAWPKLAEAVMSPVLGPLTGRLAALMPADDSPQAGGSAYIDGWYGYVEKDLRALLGRQVTGRFSTRFCGGGDVGLCRASLWAAMASAAAELAAAQGPDPTRWRADANRERIKFASGILTDTMRWTNRPTYQQVMSFDSHRPR